MRKQVSLSGVMERHGADYIMVFPRRQEVHFSDLRETTAEGRRKTVEDFDAGAQLATDALELRTSVVFFERFFNKVPSGELAERLGVTTGTVNALYFKARDKVERIAAVLDRRQAAEKHLAKAGANGKKFSTNEKLFLLTCIFGFSTREAAEVLDLGINLTSAYERQRRLENTFRAAFDSVDHRRGERPPRPRAFNPAAS